jgi:hypothetical protein
VLGSDGKATGYGNSGVGIILGPGQFNWDMSLVKTTTVGGLREDATLQFRTGFIKKGVALAGLAAVGGIGFANAQTA